MPLRKTYNTQLARNEMYLTDTFLNSVAGKRDATQVDAQIATKLAGTITPTKIEIVGDLRSQVEIKSTSDSADLPAEIGFNRKTKTHTWIAM